MLRLVLRLAALARRWQAQQSSVGLALASLPAALRLLALRLLAVGGTVVAVADGAVRVAVGATAVAVAVGGCTARPQVAAAKPVAPSGHVASISSSRYGPRNCKVVWLVNED